MVPSRARDGAGPGRLRRSGRSAGPLRLPLGVDPPGGRAATCSSPRTASTAAAPSSSPSASPTPGSRRFPGSRTFLTTPTRARSRASTRAGASSSSASATPASSSPTGCVPWARQIFLVSPRPVQTAVLATATVRVRYFEPLEDAALGRRHVRSRRGGRADRAHRKRRLPPPRSGDDPAGPDNPRGGRGDRGYGLSDTDPRSPGARARHCRRWPDPRADARTGRARRCRASTSPGTRCRAPPACGRTVSGAHRER